MIQLVELYEIISQVCNFDWYIDVQKIGPHWISHLQESKMKLFIFTID